MPRVWGDERATRQIVLKWAPYVQRVHGQTPSQWAGAMRQTFAQADLANLQRAAQMKTYGGMMAALMGQRLTDEEVRLSMARATTEVGSRVAEIQRQVAATVTALAGIRSIVEEINGTQQVIGAVLTEQVAVTRSILG